MNFLLLSALDYRTSRKANMHFIASALSERGVTRFFSLRYSRLSTWTRDPRTSLDARSNRIERWEGVDCYLRKTFVHPFNTRRRWLRPIEDLFFLASQRRPPPVLVRWMRDADVIFFESGSAILYAGLAEAVNPAAKRVYIASDDLDAIRVADFVKREFRRVAPHMAALCLPSPLLAPAMPPGGRSYFVPHGIDHRIADQADPSPYEHHLNAVSVGSMLFDRRFFEQAAPLFPDVRFHVIGAGLPDDTVLGSNVQVYPEMPYADTLRYIKHAHVGIAPYIADSVPRYLADTSMKMMQYRFFGIPAVCPQAVVGDATDRFGYDPTSAASIAAALRLALAAHGRPGPAVLGWPQVVDRLLDPDRYPDTALAHAAGAVPATGGGR